MTIDPKVLKQVRKALSRVLFLHDRLRNVTKGQPFETLSERRD